MTGKTLQNVQNGFTFSDKNPKKGQIDGDVNLNLASPISNVTDLVIYYGKNAESDKKQVGSVSAKGFKTGSLATLKETDFTGEEKLFLFLKNSTVTEGSNEVYSGVSLSVIDSLDEEGIEQIVSANSLKNALFDYDKAILKAEDRAVLDKFVSSNNNNLSTVRIVVAGHADERGSNEYNLALGERRALSVKNYLVLQGVPSANIRTLSYGEERPACNQSSKSCWRKNRRTETQISQ